MNLVKCRRSNMPLSLEGQTSKKVKAETTRFLMNLPSDILVEILSRLPAIDVTKSKLVCRKWLNIFSTREFAKLHLSRWDPCVVAFHFMGPELFCRIFELDGINDPSDLYNDPVIEFHLSVFPEIPRILYFSAALVCSVNGLICLRYCSYHLDQDILCVCNPVTREYVILPMFEGVVERFQFVVYGFGVSSISGQYKAVRIRHHMLYREKTLTFPIGIKQFECCVYTLGTSSWRTIGGVTSKYAYCDTLYNNGLCLNGNLHWLIVDFEGSDLISCFDLEKESFQPFPPPFTPKESRDDNFCLGVVKGCLCLCDNSSKSDIAIWVMKEYGVKKSWAKDFVINKMPYCYGALKNYKIAPLEIFKDGDILFTADIAEYDGREYLLAYSNKSKTVRMIDKNFKYTMIMHHVSSFVSLKNFEPEKVRMFEDLHQDKFCNSKVQG